MNRKLKIISSIVLSLSMTMNYPAEASSFSFLKKHPELTAVGAVVVVGGFLVFSQTIVHKARDLSFHLEKVKPFFRLYPQDFNPISQYVLHALAHPASKADYDRYKKLAQKMELDGIPPYSPPKINDPKILVNPQQTRNPVDSVLVNPVQEQLFGNIIFNPQGEAIDTTTEFPYEKPRSWEDYVLLKQYSTSLGDNMVKAGQQKPPNTASHHLISATAPETKQARAILEKYLRSSTPVGEETFNNEINGAFLPNNQNIDPNVPGILHNGRHPRIYNEAVNKIIVDADIQGGWPEVQQKLKTIKQNLLNANRTDQWKNMP